jgi:RimJ/RimL family protein N-acetyltransferase
MPPEKCFIADIKLLPAYWGQGLGTEAMRQVVQVVFGNSDCEIFVVPPHKDNPAAYRVYEKAGFSLITGKKGGKYLLGSHMLMKLTRKKFEAIYK